MVSTVMRQFKLEEYLKDPNQKVVTGYGRNVEIQCTNFMPGKPIIALVEGYEYSSLYDSDGRVLESVQSPGDLFFDSGKCFEKHEGWVNVYRGVLRKLYVKYFPIFESKEKAEESAKNDRNYVRTIKIEWEE